MLKGGPNITLHLLSKRRGKLNESHYKRCERTSTNETPIDVTWHILLQESRRTVVGHLSLFKP